MRRIGPLINNLRYKSLYRCPITTPPVDQKNLQPPSITTNFHGHQFGEEGRTADLYYPKNPRTTNLTYPGILISMQQV